MIYLHSFQKIRFLEFLTKIPVEFPREKSQNKKISAGTFLAWNGHINSDLSHNFYQEKQGIYAPGSQIMCITMVKDAIPGCPNALSPLFSKNPIFGFFDENSR